MAVPLPTVLPEPPPNPPVVAAAPNPNAFIVEHNIDGSAQMVPVFPVMFHPGQTPANPGTVVSRSYGWTYAVLSRPSL